MKILCLMIVLTVTALTAANAVALSSFSAEYDISRGVLKLGVMHRQLDIDAGNNYIFKSTMSTSGLAALFSKAAVVESSRGRIENNRLLPEQYAFDKEGTRKDFTLHFDYESDVVMRPESNPPWTATMPEALLDKLSYQAQMMIDLATQPSALSYAIADKGALKQYLITVSEPERVETRLGDFMAVKLERASTDSKRRTTVWCAEALGWMPVKVEHRDKHGDLTTALLRSLTPQPPAAGK